MPTSSFGKQFYVPQETVEEFLEEMNKSIEPTLTKEFKSQLKQGRDAELFLQKIPAINDK